MSRAQENQVLNTTTAQNATAAQNAQNSYNSAQTDIGNYQNQLSQYAAANPYGAGGALQTAQNQATANTADAASQAAGQQLQSQAVRTGQNAAGGIAASQATQQQNTRDLMAEQAKNNASRISQGADYGKSVLSASEVPATLEAGLTGQQLTAQNSAESDAQKAAETPSFGDELGNSLLSLGSSFASGYGKNFCWIAAELYGGWEDPRTILVRMWLQIAFARRWYGLLLLAAYARWGEKMAARIKTQRRLRRFFQWVFDGLLAQAEEWLATKDGRNALRVPVSLQRDTLRALEAHDVER